MRDRLVSRLDSHLPGWSKGNSGFWRSRTPALIFGFHFEKSRLASDVYRIKAVIYPLLLGRDYLILTYSQDIFSNKGQWSIDFTANEDFFERMACAVQKQASGFLMHGSSIESFLNWLEASEKNTNVNYYQLAIYMHVYSDDLRAAKDAFRKLSLVVDPSLSGWQRDVFTQSEQLLRLASNDMNEARVFLDQLCETSRKSLGVGNMEVCD